mgnify:FL=1
MVYFQLSQEYRDFVDSILDKYSVLSKDVLIGISHLTDAYMITTNNEKIMGGKIDKKLALLETFLLEDDVEHIVNENELPAIDRSQLVRYDTR